jgi:hypothetical protein
MIHVKNKNTVGIFFVNAPQKKESKSKDLLSFFSEIRLQRVKFGFAK